MFATVKDYSTFLSWLLFVRSICLLLYRVTFMPGKDSCLSLIIEVIVDYIYLFGRVVQ